MLPRTLAVLCLALGSTVRAEAGLAAELPAPSSSACPSPDERHLQAAVEAVRAAWLPGKPAERKKISGVTLTDDPRLLSHLERVLGQQAPSTWDAARSCSTVLCALTATLGSAEAALWVLATGADGGPVLSLDQAPFEGDEYKGAESTWSASEARLVFRAMADLPKALKDRATKLRAFRRLPDGANPFHNANGYSTRATAKGGGEILLRDTVWKMPLRQQREVVAHEVGHHLDFAQGSGYPISHGKDWLALSGWHQVAGDLNAKDGWTVVPGATAVSPGEAIPSEQFPDAIADYRYNPRMLRAHGPARYDFIRGLYAGADYQAPRKNPALDAALAKLGGPLGAYKDLCAPLVQRATQQPGWPQAKLYTVTWKKGGGSNWAIRDRAAFVSHSDCVAVVLEQLGEGDGRSLRCALDDEELWVDLSMRLDDVSAAYVEAAMELERQAGGAPAACLDRGDLTEACLLGRASVEAQAKRILAAYQVLATPDAVTTLGRQLQAASVIAPSDEALAERLPSLGSAQEFWGTCAGGAFEVSTYVGKPDTWKFWVRVPPDDAVKGFTSPLWTAACPRDFAAALKAQRLTLDPAGPLFEHLTYVLKNQAAALTEKFTARVLKPYPRLRAKCGVPVDKKATAEQQPCMARQLEPLLDGIVPPAQAGPFAQQLAAGLRGP